MTHTYTAKGKTYSYTTTGDVKPGWHPKPRPAKEVWLQVEQDAEFVRVLAELSPLPKSELAQVVGRLGRECYLSSVEPGHGPHHLAAARYAAALEALGECPKGGALRPGSRWVATIRGGVQLIRAGETIPA